MAFGSILFLGLSVVCSHGRPLKSVARGGGLFGGKKKEAPQPAVPETTTGAIGKVAIWTVTETAFAYSILNWASSQGEPNLELAAAVVLIYGSAALSDVVFGLTARALSPPAVQMIKPTSVLDPDWYKSLPKPKWTPPNWLFPIAWLLILKPLQVVAVGRLHSGLMTNLARLAFCLHLALGDAWNRVFFGEKLVGLGAGVIYAFLADLALTASLFGMTDTASGLLLVPTIIWVNVAAALNLKIFFNLKRGRA